MKNSSEQFLDIVIANDMKIEVENILKQRGLLESIGVDINFCVSRLIFDFYILMDKIVSNIINFYANRET